MPFIGNQPALSYTSFAKQDFSTSATTTYTLDHAVTNENELALFINFVRQEAGTAYSASGTTLTLTSATSSSDDMYAIFLGKAIQTVNPPNASVGLSQLTASGTKDTTTFLRGDNSFAVPASGTNTPAFEAYLSSNQTISQSTNTKVNFDTEIFDTDNCYDNSSNYRFTPTTAGKYFCFYQVQSSWTGGSGPNSIVSRFLFNGSASSTLGATNFVDYTNSVDMVLASMQSGIINFNGSSDYLEIQHNSNAPTPRIDSKSYFGAYKIIE